MSNGPPTCSEVSVRPSVPCNLFFPSISKYLQHAWRCLMGPFIFPLRVGFFSIYRGRLIGPSFHCYSLLCVVGEYFGTTCTTRTRCDDYAARRQTSAVAFAGSEKITRKTGRSPRWNWTDPLSIIDRGNQ